MGEVLVLNGGFQPIRTISWQRAIILWYAGRAEILEEYDSRFLHSQKMRIPMPAIIRLTNYFKGAERLLRTAPPFSRKNIYERDRGICQYCGLKIRLNDMTLDHVVPRAHGGKHEWANVVTCCPRCNNAKADRTPAQAGMPLCRKPVKPSFHLLLFHTSIPHIPHPSWKTYLYPFFENRT